MFFLDKFCQNVWGIGNIYTNAIIYFVGIILGSSCPLVCSINEH